VTVVSRLIAIAYFVEVGILLVVVPWTDFLLRNYFVEGWPLMRTVLGLGAVKGLISGVGVLNLGAGLAELIGLFTGRRGVPVSPPPAQGSGRME
jgi:hypothetical protein